MNFTTKCFWTSCCSLIALGFMTSGLILIISNAGSSNPIIQHKQSIGLGLIVGATISIIGTIGYYICFQKPGNGGELDYEIV